MDTTVVKGLSVLELLSKADEPLRLTDIAGQLDLQKSNVHRLLGTLTALGYVGQEEGTGRYRPTLKLWEIGSNIQAQHPVKRAAAPYMQEVHRTTGETVSLTILDGDEILFLDKIVSPRPQRFLTRPGSRAFAILTAPGKAMLAFDPKAEGVARRFTRTAAGKTLDVVKFMKELEKIRERGYGLSTSTNTPGVVGVAAPIMSRDGRSTAALSVTGPADRLTADVQMKAADALMHACARIAEVYGG